MSKQVVMLYFVCRWCVILSLRTKFFYSLRFSFSMKKKTRKNYANSFYRRFYLCVYVFSYTNLMSHFVYISDWVVHIQLTVFTTGICHKRNYFRSTYFVCGSTNVFIIFIPYVKNVINFSNKFIVFYRSQI